MGDASAIEWTDATWNPIRGCSRVSEGCRNCYAERTAVRHVTKTVEGELVQGAYYGLVQSTPAGPRWTGEVRFAEDVLDAPLRWTKPRRIFVNSMSDLFHEKVEERWIDAIFAVMAQSPNHTFQILTKRPERMHAYLTTEHREDRIEEVALQHFPEWCHANTEGRWPLPNVHLGVSVENQETFDERVELLGRTPAAVRFLSMEPLLEQIDLGNALDDAPEGSPYGPLHWIIVGGESGPGARPCDLAWIRSIRDQAKAAGVPCFVKQLGALPTTWVREGRTEQEFPMRLRDRKGGDPAEWPEDLRVREFPNA